jgi:hypothetical protein
VRIPRETSKKLDRLAARILLRTGRKISKQDLVDLIVETGLDEEALAARILDMQFPLPDEVWNRVKKKSLDWGVETREEDIDRILYGVSE